MANTTWNPADKIANVTLSNGNLTAAFAGVAGQGVRTIASQTSGKYYFEYTGTAWSGGNLVAGIAVATTSLTNLYAGNSTADCVVVETGGFLFVDGAASGSIGATPAGAVVGIALDVTSQLIWFRIAPSGNWNGSGTANPATGTGGLSTAAVTGGGAAVYGVTGTFTGSGDTIIANFGDSAFTGAVPSGFTAGFPVLANFVDLAGNLGGVSSYGKGAYGAKLYSRVAAFEPTFATDLLVSAGITFSGDLAPAVSFSANLGVIWGLSGDLAPAVSFGADLTRIGFVDFSGDLALQIALGSSLSVVLDLLSLAGGLTPIVVLGASSFISGPLWPAAEPCPPSMWTPTDLGSSPWAPADPCDPVDWNDGELCNG